MLYPPVPPVKNRTNLDYTETLARRGDMLANYILAVEDASEIGKSYMFREGVFEQILRDLVGQEGHCQTFSNRSKVKCSIKPREFLHIGLDIPNVGGHYSGAVKSGNTVYYFDSMCESPYRESFTRYFKKRYGGKINVKQEFSRNRFQPSGGFAPNKNSLRGWLKNAKINTDLNQAFYISQFDVLSQHHFCYIESLLYLFHKVLRTPMGSSKNPELRLRFIKSIMWCLIMKYSRPNQTTNRFKYFANNFQYYVKLKNVVYHPKGFYLPTPKKVGFELKKIKLMSPEKARNSTIPEIIRWCLFH